MLSAVTCESESTRNRKLRLCIALLSLPLMIWAAANLGFAAGSGETTPNGIGPPSAAVPKPAPSVPSPEAVGITFVEGSTTTVLVERDGKKYRVDLVSHKVQEVTGSTTSAAGTGPATASANKTQAMAQTQATQQAKPEVYQPGDDYVFSLPTGRRLERHGFYVNFDHRFAFNTAFTGKARGHLLLGLDDFSISSFGFRYGVTQKFSVGIYRSPSVIGRPIQLSAGYNVLDEHDGDPLNAAFRFSVEGQNDFSRNYTTDFEAIFSRSVTTRAQIYVVPAVSLHARPLAVPQRRIEDPFPYQPCQNAIAADVGGRTDIRPCANTFSLGIAGAIDIRPTVALVAEVIPTLVNGRDLGIHRPAYAFGIQKKIWRHAFTFGFSNSPGTTVSQRAETRATMLADPSADTPAGLFVGFDLTRQIF
jgi:hypothetical protein